ncbi:hypothetical protein PspLS_00067 [Pyricularia sp. CBS 133598]|nr:hypothetical protein PspLS_00067 [Pyricularia sp. CBS 133598]
MASFQPTNSDTAWQREKTTIIQAITKVAPSTVLLDVLCVPLEVVGGAVSRTVVICTETRIDNATRAAIRTRIAALNPCKDPFDVVYRTGEINRIYAEVIGARKEWIAAVFDEPPVQTQGAAAVAVSQGLVARSKGEGVEGVEAKKTLTMVDDLVKAEVAKALQEIEAETAADQVDAEVFQAIEQIEAEVKAGRLPRAPKTISAIPSRLQTPSKPASPRGIPRPHARSQSLSMCPKQNLSAAPKAQGQQQQQQPKTLPRAHSVSRLQGPRKTASLCAPLRAPVKSKLEILPKAKSQLAQPRARTELVCKSVTPQPSGKALALPQVQGLPRPVVCVSSGVGGPSTRIGMLPRALPRPTRG